MLGPSEITYTFYHHKIIGEKEMSIASGKGYIKVRDTHCNICSVLCFCEKILRKCAQVEKLIKHSRLPARSCASVFAANAASAAE